ncbi:EutN/CcmL family microcompartment protein [Lacticaseibacillus baoqingensis]|uniref:EutN/CcmL family microcompartment protein n=1 Tax=Lacticaseibacillus baoqingensis TaxID=2486013 RepID=A0ABW4EB07_9LACO|nr:EutN/CcmL family microcompartment protein [Lacticaseibacillus baoqingensis]
MLTAKLVGNIWATRKSEALNGFKLMLAKVIGGTRAGEQIVVIDTVGGGVGDRVIVVTGSSARRMLDDDNIPTDAAVVGIIDADCPLLLDE